MPEELSGNGYARTGRGPSTWPTVTHRAVVAEDEAGNLVGWLPLDSWLEQTEWLRSSSRAAQRRAWAISGTGLALLGAAGWLAWRLRRV